MMRVALLDGFLVETTCSLQCSSSFALCVDRLFPLKDIVDFYLYFISFGTGACSYFHYHIPEKGKVKIKFFTMDRKRNTFVVDGISVLEIRPLVLQK